MAINDKHNKLTNSVFGGNLGAENKMYRESHEDQMVLWICMTETLKDYDADKTINLHQTFMNKINGYSPEFVSGMQSRITKLKEMKVCLCKTEQVMQTVCAFENRFNASFPLLEDPDADGEWTPKPETPEVPATPDTPAGE